MNELMQQEMRTKVLAGEINGIKEQVRSTVAAGAVEIGKRLKEAKSLVPYGKWGEWLQENVDYSERTAQTMMRLADEYGRGSVDMLESMSITQATLILGVPKEDRENFLEQHDLEHMSTRELEAEVARLKEENEKKQLTIDEMLGLGANGEDNFEKAHGLEGSGRRGQCAQEETQAPAEALQEELEAHKEAAQKAKQEAEEAKKALKEKEKKAAKERRELKKRKQAAEEAAQKAKQEAETAKRALEAQKAETEKTKELLKDAKELLANADTKVQKVEVVPEAVEKELKLLREKSARSEGETALRAAFEVYKEAFERLMRKIAEAETAESAETVSRYREAFAKAAVLMAERMKG